MKLRRSRHLSFFQQGADVYLHHDLVGDIIRMDRALLDFIDFFAEPRTGDGARERFRDRFPREDLDQFLEILPAHRCLVAEGEDEEEALDAWYPVRGPWTFLYAPSKGPVEIGWVDRRSGEVVLERPGLLEARAIRLSDGTRTLRDVWFDMKREFADVQDLASKVRGAVFRLVHSDRQFLKLAPEPLSAYEGGKRPAYLDSTMPFERLREAEARPPEDVATTRDYHRASIRDADEQFDVRETTLSHAFRLPHPALGGKTYGGRLAKALVERDVLRDDGGRGPLRAVEVGGGTGVFAAGFLDGLAIAAPRLYHRLRYTIVDLSPALQESQRIRTRPQREKVRLLQGDALRLPFASSSLDFLIANEMVADLPTARVSRGDLAGDGEGATVVRRYRLPVEDAPDDFFVNSGACRFVEEVARALRPGGRAILTEFGERDRYPVESTHLDHREFSIHFGHVRAAAEAVGLAASVEDLADVLEVDGTVAVLATNRSFFLVLRAFLARAGVALEKVAYTPASLAEAVQGKVELERVEGLGFAPCGERVLGLRLREFKALLLSKPGGGAEAKARRVSLEL